MLTLRARLGARLRSDLSEGLPLPFWALLAGTFVNRAGSFILPLLFIYLTTALRVPMGTAGIVVAVGGVGSIFGSALGGLSADRFGRRRTMLVALVSSACFMLLLAEARELWHIALAAFCLSLTGDAYRPACQALVTDIVRPAHRVRAFALQYWVINLGFIFAAVIGGLLAERNFALLFYVDATTTLALAAFIWRLVPDSAPEPTALTSGAPASGSFFTPFVDGRFMLFALLNLAVVVVFFQHLTALPADMRTHGLGTEAFGLVLSVNGALIILLQPAITRWLSSVPRATLLSVASALTGIGFGITAFASSIPTFMISVAFWTLGEIIFAPVNATIVADLSPPHLRGRYQGAFALTWSSAAVLSPAIGPRVFEAIGFGAFWGICFAICVATAVTHRLVTSRALQNPR